MLRTKVAIYGFYALTAFAAVTGCVANDPALSEKLSSFISYERYSQSDVNEARSFLSNLGVNSYLHIQNNYRNQTGVLPGSEGKVVFVNSTIRVAPGRTFDGNGNIYVWTGSGDCSQAEGMRPMFEVYDGARLQNLFMIYAPDGVHVYGSNVVIDNIVNLDVCEDAISTPVYPAPPYRGHSGSTWPYENIVISNSRFYNCEDKGIQLNSGTDVYVVGNSFVNCAQPIREKDDARHIPFRNSMSGMIPGYAARR